MTIEFISIGYTFVLVVMPAIVFLNSSLISRAANASIILTPPENCQSRCPYLPSVG